MTDDSGLGFLLSIDQPAIGSPMDALRLLVGCDGEWSRLAAATAAGESVSAYEVAAQRRRRAYVLAHAGRLWPEFAEPAALAVAEWEAAEALAAAEAVRIARGDQLAGAPVELVAEREP